MQALSHSFIQNQLAYYEFSEWNSRCKQPELEGPVGYWYSLSTMALSSSFFWTTLRNTLEQISWSFIHLTRFLLEYFIASSIHNAGLWCCGKEIMLSVFKAFATFFSKSSEAYITNEKTYSKSAVLTTNTVGLQFREDYQFLSTDFADSVLQCITEIVLKPSWSKADILGVKGKAINSCEKNHTVSERKIIFVFTLFFA